MNEKLLLLLIFLADWFVWHAIIIISFIIMIKSRECKTERERKVNKISKIIFWVVSLLIEPLFAIIYGVITIMKQDNKLGSNNYSGNVTNYPVNTTKYHYRTDTKYYSYTNKDEDDSESDSESNYESNDGYGQDSREEETEPYKRMAFSYNSSNVSTIYNDGSVVRDDGTTGTVIGDCVHYNDGTVDLIGSDGRLTRI